jgi:hypothetical protein
MSETRKIAAILVSDVVGYSRLRRRPSEDGRPLACVPATVSTLLDTAADLR